VAQDRWLGRSNIICGLALVEIMNEEAAMTHPKNQAHPQPSDTKLNPGEEAQRRTPGTGEDVCPQCHGSSNIDGARCPNCGGRGTNVKGIAGG
jgi:hypothetical protein